VLGIEKKSIKNKREQSHFRGLSTAPEFYIRDKNQKISGGFIADCANKAILIRQKEEIA